MIKTLLLVLLLPILSICQDKVIVIDCNERNHWKSGDIFVGVNSPATDRSFLDLKLSPSIGYALSDLEMLYIGGWYYDSDPSNYFISGGYNRKIVHTLFAGVGAYLKNDGVEDSWGMSAKVGFYRDIWKGVYFSPSIDFTKNFSTDDPFAIYTSVSFGLKM